MKSNYEKSSFMVKTMLMSIATAVSFSSYTDI